MDFYSRGDLGDSSQRDDSGSSFFADSSCVRYRPDARRAGRSSGLEGVSLRDDRSVDPDVVAGLKDSVDAILGRVEYLLDTCRKKYEEFCGPENTNLINIALNEAFDSTVRDEYAAFLRQLDRIFPKGLAEVNVPEDCQVKIPKVNRWQRNSGIRDREEADRAYASETQKAKERTAEAFTSDGIDRRFEIVPLKEVGIDGGFMKRILERLDGIERDFPPEKVDQIIRGVSRKMMADFLESYLPLIRDIEKFLDLGEAAWRKTEIDAIIKANAGNIRQHIKKQLEDRFTEALQNSLSLLAEELRTYQCAEPIAQSGLTGAAKKKRSKRKKRGRRNCASSRVGSSTEKPVQQALLTKGDTVAVTKELFPWLADDETDVPVLGTKNGCGGGTVVLDMRTDAAKEVEYKMAGYETEASRDGLLSFIQEKLMMVANSIATSSSRNDVRLEGLFERDSDKYPFRIMSWKEHGAHNPRRVYMCWVDVEKMPECAIKNRLREAGVTNLLSFVGACDKNHQVDLLREFTSKNSRRLVNQNVGPK